MKNSKRTIKGLMIIMLGVAMITSCKKYKKYDNAEVIKNTYTGTMSADNDSDPDGDFIGDDNSGIYSFAWTNSKEKAKVKLSLNGGSTGTVKITLNEAKGKKVFENSLTGTSSDVSFENISDAGKVGVWKVTVEFTNFKGDGSYEIDPAN